MSENKDTVMPEIVGLLKVMIQRQDSMILRQDETNATLKALVERVDRGLTTTQKEHEARLAKLEAAVFPKPTRPTRRAGARR